jgi:FkbM family methyltransferase
MVKAPFLFYALILLRWPHTICDVGSCDGADAFRFRRMRPGARVIAFEANPDNYMAIRADPHSAGIEVRPEAASDEDGEATFYVLEVPPDQLWAKGASSLNRRGAEIQEGLVERPVQVTTCRLDTVLSKERAPIALWVDVEGAASKVVSGLKGIADRVSFIVIELEPRPLWQGQVPAPQVLEQLAEIGFREVARTQQDRQLNVVLTREIGAATLLAAKAIAVVGQGGRSIFERLTSGNRR